jgi:large subunit ribosomal protein L32
MAVPKKRKTSARGKQGRAHKGLNAPELTVCTKCGSPKMPHQVCSACGYYGEKKVLDIETKLDKKLRKEKKAAKKEATEGQVEEK